jgi:hypothetical protein
MDGTEEVSQAQNMPKLACSPSYAETNAAILLDIGHTLRGYNAREA